MNENDNGWNKRKKTCTFLYIQKEKNAKRFYIQKGQTLCKKQENSRYVFIYKKKNTLRYAILNEIFEVGIFIQKAWHFELRDVFIYKTTDTLQKARNFALQFYIQKSGHFVLHNFSLNFWNKRSGGENFYMQKIMHFALHFYMQKTQHSALRFYMKNAWHFALYFIRKKKLFALHYICKIYLIVLIPITERQ